ncbi:acylphosphatase [Desulfobulbus alkaliphilus]|uniref:acylphosphatase n=1 Tax=Desulfobulbus alkaliphilus TaxID=869814 RepID=UPI001962FFAC|nr:acylphosphatase [Desulfobulbus alkaliphilus]MBM9537219.1 acylphosphatase [Desulfobulbus alkaliphilus]
MERKRVRARVYGRVQGVAFREHTRQEALRLGLSGWVANRPDGTVEVVCEGALLKVDELVAWLAIGSPFSRVSRVECAEESPLNDATAFLVRHFA